MRAAADRLETDRRRVARLGLAAVLAFLLLPAAARTETLICGHPARSRVTVQREGRIVAAFTAAEAESVSQRGRGLMHCPALGPGTGMLFIYADARPRVFWMKDTPLDLGIVFIDAESRIAGIARGLPQSLTRIRSQGPARFVLEINYDEARDLQVGDLVDRSATGAATRSSPPQKE